ncbi:glycosyl transferase family 90 [Octadecabacter sp. 1_MG-2023]|uniref:glycosyl transferase family 90 n=1 Tax=unclassified Octadecabacter TaxID=196158 RepID=UPI001C094E83|nr:MULTISPECIES: glycosyl transferase family 90 [unclassified Octadecabacter]MBU2993417.1 sulfotransferase [Octadecabacter sp. B2R22]MDO6733127.1 glycosyl transferase family 90 [Octadecabacter sp. 1_MG-2023]
MAKWPLVFGIGLPHSGGKILPALFQDNGYAWSHYMGGKLAVDLAYAQATDGEPFKKWPNAVGFSGLYRTDKRHLPALTPRDTLEFLIARYPDAYFIHTHRDPADWITARFLADGGDHRVASAWHAKTNEAQVLDHWAAEHDAHAAFCKERLRGKRRYLNFNVTTDPIENIHDFLKRDFDLAHAEALPDFDVLASDVETVLSYVSNLEAAQIAPKSDASFTQHLIDFALEKRGKKGVAKVLNANAVHWRDDGTFANRMAEPTRLVQAENGMILTDVSSGLDRAQGTLTEMIAHGVKPPLFIDMMDARFLGTPDNRTPPHRTVVYNRRIGAKNLTLWPLPAYHSLAPTGASGGFPADKIAFENKTDRCVWLGNMTGRMSPVLAPEGRTLRSVYGIRSQALDLTRTAPEWADVIADLMCVPRYNLVKSLRDHPDYAVGLVLRDKWKRLAKSPAFVGMSVAKRPREWFHQFRYVLSISGNDTGSNFLSAAASNSLILKEEDGWELFYTDAFKPWVHYVPLEEGAQDVVEKLEWARAHPTESAAMARAATEVYDKLADPVNRATLLRGIAEHLNTSD